MVTLGEGPGKRHAYATRRTKRGAERKKAGMERGEKQGFWRLGLTDRQKSRVEQQNAGFCFKRAIKKPANAGLGLGAWCAVFR